MTEFNRFLRHAFAPLVMWLVASGYLPEYMRDDVLEAVIIVASIGAPMIISKVREKWLS